MESFRLALQTHGNLFCKLQIRFRIDGRESKIINLDSSLQVLQTNEKFFFQTWLLFSNYWQKNQKEYSKRIVRRLFDKNLIIFCLNIIDVGYLCMRGMKECVTLIR